MIGLIKQLPSIWNNNQLLIVRRYRTRVLDDGGKVESKQCLAAFLRSLGY
jgi:hypothetical protein